MDQASRPTIETSAYDIMDGIEREITGLADDAPRARSVLSLATAAPPDTISA